MTDKQQLTRLTEIMLDPASYPGVLRDAVIALTDFFAQCSGLSVPSDMGEPHQGTPTEGGVALSPNYAVRSMIDYNRTVQFIRGLRLAIEAAMQKFDAPIHVLYAGTGPYAPLALPLATVFAAEQVQFTLLDIHRESLDAVQHIVRKLALRDHVKAYVRANAITYQHSQNDPIHIIGPGDQVRFYYEVSDTPGMRYDVLRDAPVAPVGEV